MKLKLLATVISWCTVLRDYNKHSVERKGTTQKLFGPWPWHMAGDHRPGAPGQGFQLLACYVTGCLQPCALSLPIALHPLTPQGPGDPQCFQQLPIHHGWALLLSWAALVLIKRVKLRRIMPWQSSKCVRRKEMETQPEDISQYAADQLLCSANDNWDKPLETVASQRRSKGESESR